MLNFENAIRGRSVLVTGHTGFTGTWLTAWLRVIGAEVSGLSLAPETTPSLWQEAGAGRDIRSIIADIRDFAAVEAAITHAKPDLVLHLAAQPLVRRSYRDPLDTYSTNVLGTLNLLEAARLSDTVKAFVCVTTDKVYQPQTPGYALLEGDRLGGADPYSASKAAAEIVAASYQATMSALGNGVAIATVRGGNIIGGGDWSEDRIIPDFIRAWRAGKPLMIRSPDAVRPWQHVLSACYGYLAVGAALVSGSKMAIGGWNVGPSDRNFVTVREVIDRLGSVLPQAEVIYEPSPLKETGFLYLDASKLRETFGVSNPWTTDETIKRTATWYRNFYLHDGGAAKLIDTDIAAFRSAIAATQP